MGRFIPHPGHSGYPEMPKPTCARCGVPEGWVHEDWCIKEREEYAKERAAKGSQLFPTRLPTDTLERKRCPIASGVLDYFPNALAAIAECSLLANEQHSPGEPLHWARGKSTDEADALLRHLIERGSTDTDGIRHSTKVAWRALALLQKELELVHGLPISRGSRAA